MPDSGHLFIRPWFHPDETWAGFHVEFAGPDEAFPAALSRLAAHPALAAMDQRLTWFVPAIGGEGAALLPGKQVVWLLAAGAENRERLEAGLRHADARLGLVLGPNDGLPPTGAWAYVALSMSHARTVPAFQLLGLSAKSAIAIGGLRNRNDLAWAVANRCSLVTSEYLLNRSAPSNKPDMLRVRLLKLLGLIATDADTGEIEEVFRQEPKLAYGLLRLVNSAAMAPRSPITSFAQAITILGRQQLQRWLQLVVYADPNDGQHPNPLLLHAATRGHLMESLVARLQPAPEVEAPADAAFMVGTFSLLDVLLDLPMTEILQQLPLPHPIHAALERQQGFLGRLLMALCTADNRETASASHQLDKLGIDGETFLSAQLDTLRWAGGIRAACA